VISWVLAGVRSGGKRVKPRFSGGIAPFKGLFQKIAEMSARGPVLGGGYNLRPDVQVVSIVDNGWLKVCVGAHNILMARSCYRSGESQ
jgi:hypothetical protein